MSTNESDDANAQALEHKLAEFQADPLGFVRWAFPWGEAGTPLQHATGPEKWQADTLDQIAGRLARKGRKLPILIAVASGHGVGKSALVAWLVIWGMATGRDTRGVVTANTEIQLKTKTWAEMAKWFRMSPVREMFRLTATAIQARDPERAKTWRIDMVPWSLSQTESFAGLHNLGLRVLLVFDEASAIPAEIWEVAEGSLTDKDTEIIWAVFGNPTQPAGRFREAFGRRRHRWITRHVDSRETSLTNEGQIAQWIADYGEESDFVRVRVKGEFPRTSSRQFIPGDRIDAARQRRNDTDPEAPRVLGVDVARFGDDQSVILLRQGDRIEGEIQRFQGIDLMQLAGHVAERIANDGPDAVFVDGAGVGGGVIDRLRQMNLRVHDINGGEAARRSREFLNRRAEMWSRMRSWLKTGDIPDDSTLAADLTGPEYGFDAKGRIQLERKEDMKRRGLASPDAGDALSLTFADFVGPKRDHQPSKAETSFRILR